MSGPNILFGSCLHCTTARISSYPNLPPEGDQVHRVRNILYRKSRATFPGLLIQYLGATKGHTVRLFRFVLRSRNVSQSFRESETPATASSVACFPHRTAQLLRLAHTSVQPEEAGRRFIGTESCPRKNAVAFHKWFLRRNGSFARPPSSDEHQAIWWRSRIANDRRKEVDGASGSSCQFQKLTLTS